MTSASFGCRYVAWVTAAFGPFWGFQEGWWSWLSGVTDNSVYPVLFLTYLDAVVPGERPARTHPRMELCRLEGLCETWVDLNTTASGWQGCLLGC